ncbi:TetR/AcrR family transcriptional regulator [Kribbella sp. DT2]|uniref:TetR/AcrR family transcriptional regulator n=1 Tax=Kribbella sp. DT2 TaxID=3393427 RepID=UPI003CF5E647
MSGTGRPAKYCSRACRSRAYRLRQATTSEDTTVLTLEAIVSAAVALGDEEGPDAISMRGTAARLGAGAMSLYRYVAGREVLVDLMVDHVFAEQPLPEPGPAGWRDKLELSAWAEWAVYRAHPWSARLVASITRPPLAPNVMAYTDWRMRAVDGLGLPFPVMIQVAIMLSTHLQGVALGLHAETEAASRLSREEWTALRQEALSTALAARELPMISRFGPAEYDAVTPERMFEFGLGRLLDGIAAMIGPGVSRDTAEAGTQPG